MPEPNTYNVFLCHPHTHAVWVEQLAGRLTDEAHLTVWLDKWVLIPGEDFQPEMAKGLEVADTCAVFVGAETPSGWVEQEIQKALNRQAADESFRVIPVLMDDAEEAAVNDFLELRTWVDFRAGAEEAFHRLVSGIRGEAPGRWKPPPPGDEEKVKKQLRYIASLQSEGLLFDDVAKQAQEKLLWEALANV